MDNSLTLLTVTIIIAGVAFLAGGIVWAGLRNRIPPDVAEALAEAVARLRAQVSASDAESIIRLYAGALYDVFVEDGSELTAKVSKQWFVDFCVHAIMRAQARAAQDAEMVAMAIP